MNEEMGYEGMENASREEILSEIFANMVMQNLNMAFIFMGRVPHPETGEVMRDIESAQMFIDQLEALELKSRGNLSAQEQQLMQQSLTAARMAFVEATGGRVKRPEPVPQKAPAQPFKAEPAPQPQQRQETPPAREAVSAAPPPPPARDSTKEPPDESRKRFVKKY